MIITGSGGNTTSSYLITLAGTPDERMRQIVDVVNSRREYSERVYNGVRLHLPKLYDLFRGVYTGTYHPHKNNAHIPIIFGTIWSDAARKASTSFDSWPIVQFLGYGPDDGPIARKYEGLIAAQMKDMDFFIKEVMNYVTADLYGVNVTQLMWDRTEEMRIINDIATLPISGETIRQIHKGKVITFDGPQAAPVDRLDAFPAPGYPRLEKMPWFIRRYYLDLDDVRALVKAGMFDSDALSDLEAEASNAAIVMDDALVRRFQLRAGMSEEEARWQDRYSRPVEILEHWGRIPSELAPDGVTNRVITVANRKHLLRNRPNPFWHGKIPFHAFSPMPDPHQFDAPGKAEIAEKLQIVANRYLNQSLDATDLAIDPMFIFDRNGGLNTHGLYSRPGRFIGVDGNPRDKIMPFEVNLAGIQLGSQKVAEVREMAQIGTGIIDDAVSGLQGPDRQTAREFVGRREAAGTRLLLESRIYEETYLEKITNQMVQLDKQFLETPREIAILGDGAKIDPLTGESIDMTKATMTDADMGPTYMAHAVGATTALSKSMQQANLGTVLQYITTSPEMMGAINQTNFLRMILRKFDIQNVNDVINKQGSMQDLLARATGGAPNANNVPTSGAIARGAPLPGMVMPGSPATPTGLNALQPQAA